MVNIIIPGRRSARLGSAAFPITGGAGGPDFASAVIGDEIGGGIYAGVITYADSRQFHIIAAKAAAEGIGLLWGYSYVVTTARDVDDGQANQDVILGKLDAGDDYGSTPPEIFTHCRDLTVDGYNDFYVPAKNELSLLYTSLSGHAEFAGTTASGEYTYSSTEGSSNSANSYRFSDGNYNSFFAKDAANRRGVRPVRRVAV